MVFILHPWKLLIFIMAGWINRHRQEVIEHLRTENHVLKEKLGKRCILFNNDQRQRLAVKGKVLTRPSCFLTSWKPLWLLSLPGRLKNYRSPDHRL